MFYQEYAWYSLVFFNKDAWYCLVAYLSASGCCINKQPRVRFELLITQVQRSSQERLAAHLRRVSAQSACVPLLFILPCPGQNVFIRFWTDISDVYTHRKAEKYLTSPTRLGCCVDTPVYSSYHSLLPVATVEFSVSSCPHLALTNPCYHL